MACFFYAAAYISGAMWVKWISLGVFVTCYGLFVALPNRRSWVACSGAAALLLTGALGWHDALLEKINWNVMGLFFGTLVLAELFMMSRVPAVIAEGLVSRTHTGRGAMLCLCALSSFLSIFIENVAVVLLIAPVAFSVAEKLKADPRSLLIGIAVCSNLQGTATMIGDPPSMILAGYMKLGFLDFFVYQGKPGIFFAVEVGALASLCMLAWMFRGARQSVSPISVEKARSWTPLCLLCILVLGLSFATVIDRDFRWFAGVFTMATAAIGLAWYVFRARWDSVGNLAKAMDWDTTFFLVGVFVLVGGLEESGWLDTLATMLSGMMGSHLFAAFALIVLVAVVISGFVDNVPFLLAMIPVVQKVSDSMQASPVVLLFGLLIGACLGGNITPIGASANVVTVGMLRKRGLDVSFSRFMGIGIPFTVAAVLAACGFVWVVWGG